MPISPSSARPGLIPQALVGRLPTHLVLGRGAALGIGAAGTLVVLWAATATWYVGARDDIAQRIFVREAEMQYGYEDRIRALQGQLERTLTQNLVERNGFAARVDKLALRQAEIEARQTWLKALAERVQGGPERRTMGAATPLERLSSDPATTSSLGLSLESKPSPLPDTFSMRGREPDAGEEAKRRPRDRLSALEGLLESVGADQLGLIDAVRRGARDRLGRWRVALGTTGLDMERLLSADRPAGGPLVPLPHPATDGPFGPLAAELEATLAELDRVQGAARALPLGRPLTGPFEPTSGFGYRFDPFTRAPALHTGLDIRAETGSPVRATASGRVTIAEYTGGYGNMVEIEHGNGLATRYGHLSGFAVTPSERVEAGEVIGRAGSTGRSTGSHLHYETRINGEPVDPAPFLAAGTQLTTISAGAR